MDLPFQRQQVEGAIQACELPIPKLADIHNDLMCKRRSKTVARVGRRNFVALFGSGFLSFRRIGTVRRERRESDGSVYEHGTMDGRSTCGIGGWALQA